jgi:opacity protein-like surface antigen
VKAVPLSLRARARMSLRPRLVPIGLTYALFGAGLWLLAPGSVLALSDREFTVAPTAGAAWFDEKLDFEYEASFGFRFGMEADRRFSVLMDFAQVDPARKTTGKSARVSSLRALGQCRLLTGSFRPYLMGGFGGVLFNFDDANDTAGGTASAGAGVEYAAWKRTKIFAEYSAAFYRMRSVTYSSTGSVLSTGERTTDALQSVSAGVSVGF